MPVFYMNLTIHLTGTMVTGLTNQVAKCNTSAKFDASSTGPHLPMNTSVQCKQSTSHPERLIMPTRSTNRCLYLRSDCGHRGVLWHAADGHAHAAVSRVLLRLQRVPHDPQRRAEQRAVQGHAGLERGPPSAALQLLHHPGGDRRLLQPTKK